jgi:uncharacterized protein YecE (DUF72 family)
MAKLLIGTSGWNYDGWKGRFYPRKFSSNRYLQFYAQEFGSAEVNYSFYRLPSVATYEKWHGQVPENFIFALKVSRFISHIKRLSGVEQAWQTFVDNALTLGEKLGPLLLQFPESFHRDDERLETFLSSAQEAASGKAALRLAFEFRHDSWFEEAVYEILRKHNAALCIADSPDYPRDDVVTADFAYIRYHGRTDLFASSYSNAELKKEARIIGAFLKDDIDVYVYFNNDVNAHAIFNARTLRELVQ